jgi:hypothetical protein
MSAQEFRTAVEGQLYILRTASSECQFVDAIELLLSIRNRLEQYSSNKHESIKSLIDKHVLVASFKPSDDYIHYEPSKSIDEKIDDVVDSMFGDMTVAKITGIALATFYSYAYYMWFNSY